MTGKTLENANRSPAQGISITDTEGHYPNVYSTPPSGLPHQFWQVMIWICWVDCASLIPYAGLNLSKVLGQPT